mgnify:CR=1 FL=1
MLRFEEARARVIEVISTGAQRASVESIRLGESLNRVLAQPVVSDRDYPPFHRSVRDGYAVRSVDLLSGSSLLTCVGEIKAGQHFKGVLGPGQCVQIMTGAPLPEGADAVVMIEFTSRKEDYVSIQRGVACGENVVERGAESKRGDVLIPGGSRIRITDLALMAQVGVDRPTVFRMPTVAVLSTGDEVVDASQTPGAFQIRNSNSFSLAGLVEMAGGEAVSLGNSPDEISALRKRILQGLEADILVISGGVSMGKYDLVEAVLRDLGAEFFFDAVAIRPGKPTVFGRCRDHFFFGLPGNPISTMVTFGLFVRPAIDILGGASVGPLLLAAARLAVEVRQKKGLKGFLPARLEREGDEVRVQTLSWQGSGDLVALSRSDCFLIFPDDQECLKAGEYVTVVFLLN